MKAGGTKMADKIRVLLADDHAVVRQGIRRFLEEADDIEVVAEAANGREALERIREHRPDVAVVDIRMPEMSGVEVTRRIRERYPQIRVLILTAYDDDPYVFALLQAGADGYVLKTAQRRRTGAGRADGLPGSVGPQPGDRYQSGSPGGDRQTGHCRRPGGAR
jgi:CheY-like chemotaxis protein